VRANSAREQPDYSTLQQPFHLVVQVMQTVMMRAAQMIRRVRLSLRARMALAAEHLFLQQQLALYQARNATSRRPRNATRLMMVWLSYWFDWQPALTIVQPATFKHWRRQGWRLVWKTPSKLGRPPIPPELQALIRRMARENMTWGQQRIANELLLKLGCACRREPCGNTCHAMGWEVQVIAVTLNAGQRSSVTMHKGSSSRR
jgi:hypothetical protein